MAKTPLQILIEEFTDIKYTMIINRAKELLAIEKEMLVTAVNKTDSDCCSIANNIMSIKYPKSPNLFEHDEKTGEMYYNKNFKN